MAGIVGVEGGEERIKWKESGDNCLPILSLMPLVDASRSLL